MINWKVRIKNKSFWLALIPAFILLIQQVGAIFGISFDFTNLQYQLLDIVNTIFVLLAVLGIVVDHTTDGIGDSEQALSYEKPKEDE